MTSLIGWLTPNATLVPCEYGGHQYFAREVLDEQHWKEDKYKKMGELREFHMPDDEYLKRFKNYIPISRGFVGFLIDENHTYQITQAQIKWFKENYDDLDGRQKEDVDILFEDKELWPLWN
ncbi:hypothetical protein P7D15_02660 [Bacillus cereus]|uniref:Uncharacterized protein n=1 Tax=Bacillus thuringiensis TaxID=1428 RepID=A0A9X6VCQ3_BACTU|nr:MULTISPECIES: hypothetical protein [Bacillus cereus group]MCU5280753.1 hypothetical protein [Bacillus cereus]MDF9599323.1 hypothetical protein [Bacillus cereus]MDG1589654.1 hypothetical protein [Bacillus cereus]MEC3270732.1 hypothetical protein [Bacillus thuringiensis]PFB08046.1 hypothetical protein CN398_10015 [Bacillus thuringiensis]